MKALLVLGMLAALTLTLVAAAEMAPFRIERVYSHEVTAYPGSSFVVNRDCADIVNESPSDVTSMRVLSFSTSYSMVMY